MAGIDSCFVGAVQDGPEPEQYVLLFGDGPRWFSTLEQLGQFIVDAGLSALPLPAEEGWGDARDLTRRERKQLTGLVFGALWR